jgi:hypothetical protein
MRRITTFVLGMAAGAMLIYGALTYHIVHTADGLHLVPKVESTLSATYVDLRGIDFMTLIKRYPQVAQAIAASGRNDLIGSAARDSLQTTVDQLLAPPPRNR